MIYIDKFNWEQLSNNQLSTPTINSYQLITDREQVFQLNV